MSLTAFTSRLGTNQGRLAEPGTSVGSYVFVLGDEAPGRLAELAPGDYAQVTQATDLTGVSLVRANLELRVPENTPASFAWNASILVDGNPHACASVRSGRSRAIAELCANVSKLSGSHEVAVRLELTAV
jgi:hypothetical protein